MDRLTENVIEWIDGDQTATVTFSNRYRNRLLKLAEKYPAEVSVLSVNEDGSCYGKVPLEWVTVRRPKQMNLSDERRKELSDRFALYRNSK